MTPEIMLLLLCLAVVTIVIANVVVGLCVSRSLRVVIVYHLFINLSVFH